MNFTRTLCRNLFNMANTFTVWIFPQMPSFSGTYPSVFGLNTEIYRVTTSIDSKYGKHSVIFSQFFVAFKTLEL